MNAADRDIPDLVHSLADDSKRLARDEVRLARVEVHESVHRGGQAATRLGIAFGMGVLALVAFTLLVITLVGRLASGHMWVGAFVAAIIDLAAAAVLKSRGMADLKVPAAAVSEMKSANA